MTRELPGPTTFEEWLRAWNVYVFMLVALEADSRARLDQYLQKIQELVDRHGFLGGASSWWLVALADQRMCSERMECIRRDLEEAHAEGRTKDAFGIDPRRPWDAVFLAAASDQDYWYREVGEKAIMYISHVKSKDKLVDAGHHVLVNGEHQGGDKERERRGEVLRRRDQSGNIYRERAHKRAWERDV